MSRNKKKKLYFKNILSNIFFRIWVEVIFFQKATPDQQHWSTEEVLVKVRSNGAKLRLAQDNEFTTDLQITSYKQIYATALISFSSTRPACETKRKTLFRNKKAQ